MLKRISSILRSSRDGGKMGSGSSKGDTIQQKITKTPHNTSPYTDDGEILNGNGKESRFFKPIEYKTGDPVYVSIHTNYDDLPSTLFVGGSEKIQPFDLVENPHLTALILDFNRLPTIPNSIVLFPNLKELSLGSNLIEEIPECILLLKNLEIFQIGLNPLKQFPLIVCDMVTLRTLHLETNQLVSIPQDIEKLTNLKDFSLMGNLFINTPEYLPTSLESLNLSCNNIQTCTLSTTIINSIAETLTTINLSENQLTEIDPSLGQLVNLKNLLIGCNHIKMIPGDLFRKWKCLLTLNIPHNDLTDLPPEILECKTLSVLDVRGNRFAHVRSISKSISAYSTFKLQDFIDQVQLQLYHLTNMTTNDLLGVGDGSSDQLQQQQQQQSPNTITTTTTTTSTIDPENNSENNTINIDNNNNDINNDNNTNNNIDNNNNNDTTTPTTTTTTTTTTNTTNNTTTTTNNNNDNKNNTNNDSTTNNNNHKNDKSPIIVWQSLYPDLIIDNLYLGCRECSIHKSWLRDNNITHILSVANLKPLYPNLFTYKVIDIEDVDYANLAEYFEECIQFIDDARKAGGGVIVHCRAGVSRSATIIIAYLMKIQRLNYKDAFNFTSKQRPRICPNNGFRRQLQQFEKELGLASP